jgi:hypothetical protein
MFSSLSCFGSGFRSPPLSQFAAEVAGLDELPLGHDDSTFSSLSWIGFW